MILFLHERGHGVYDCSYCCRKQARGTDPNHDWILKLVGFEGVSGLPPQRLAMICPECYERGIDTDWENADMIPGARQGDWYLNVQEIDRNAA